MQTTVTSCQKIKEVNGKPIYKVGLSDNRYGESFAAEIPPGTPIGDIDIQETQYGLKFKLKKPAYGGRPAAPKGNESFALSYAKDLVIADKVKIDQLLPTAEKLYQWLEGKRK